MVIAMLSGGLGNQMFQYACARSFAERRRDDLYINMAYYLHPKYARRYGLDMFSIRGTIINNLEIVKGSDFIHSVTQVDSRFHENIFDVSAPNVLLRGFWESEKYFINIKDTIRREFAFSRALDHSYEDLLSLINCTQSVCIHVRRTDIVEEEHKGFIGTEYYRAAIKLITERVENPVFYIFSDDVAWCHDNLQISRPHHFASNGHGSDAALAHEFMLMSNCKHFIIANSTFSWWGAWLAKHAQKIVVAPKRWFRIEGYWNPTMPYLFRSDDLIPTDWIRV